MRLAQYLIVEPNSKYRIPNVRFLSALTARGMNTQKVFTFVGPDVSNAQETIQPLIAHAKKNPRMSNAFCVRVIIQSTTKVVWFTRIREGISSQHYREKW